MMNPRSESAMLIGIARRRFVKKAIGYRRKPRVRKTSKRFCIGMCLTVIQRKMKAAAAAAKAEASRCRPAFLFFAVKKMVEAA